MMLSELSRSLQWECLTPSLLERCDADIRRGFASDLLSDVLANAPAGGLLVTIQVHMNVVAVAVHAGLAAVVSAHGRRPDAEILAKAAQERVLWFVTEEHAFDVVGRLYTLGLRGESGCAN